MARSTYIYLVIQPLGEDYLPVAAFTVKRELVAWIRRQPSALLEKLDFWRMRDNPIMAADHVVTMLDLRELLGD